MAVNPRVFISYSHDTDAHMSWVLSLATRLRANGVDVILDRWDLHPGDDLAVFMEKGVAESDRVLVVCSSAYVDKAKSSQGGVGYEKMILNAELVTNAGTRKFIPLIRNSTPDKPLPTFLGARFYIDFEPDSEFEQRLQLLIAEVHSQDPLPKPPLGPSPFSAITTGPSQPATASSAQRGLDPDWLRSNAGRALKGLSTVGFTAYTEIAFAIDGPKPSIDQKTLLQAAETSQINTFGWPIGVLIPSRAEYAPKPIADGIFAELAIGGGQRESYDYWAIRRSGDFYALMSLFEDMRSPEQIFFNTRIVRNAEALLYSHNLYTRLGLPPDTSMSFRARYFGFSGRKIGSSNPNRWVISRATTENEVIAEISTRLGDIEPTLTELTRRLTAPFLTVFDFFEVADDIYKQIIEDFRVGKVT